MQKSAASAQPSIITLLIGVIIAAAWPIVFYNLIVGAHLPAVTSIICSQLGYWVELAFLWWYADQFENQPLLIWQERQSGFKFILKWAIILFVLTVAINLLSSVMSLLGFPQNKELARQIARFMNGRWLLITTIATTAGVTEEIIFRGYILTRLSVVLKHKYLPIVISAVLFSSMHYSYHSAHEFLFTFLFAVIMAVHYQKYRNIKPLIAAHLLFDWLGFTFLHYFVK
ncbi:type II CAAX endopeptidase family protein [Mucilaginibacter sp. dw_454]|uniref:CPBP family intramembrane glutamic endopeptidase n=1 Tax=Mucilaginibacter sp. dw_454 TaxID=2720079 RepID=UPI001BD2A17B|nr:type II CAAX endopeptidase family protein [Mucilaginibacter sp. dw_454]